MKNNKTKKEFRFSDSALNSYFKQFIIMLVDFTLFSITNYAICYLTMSGHITSTAYSDIAFDYGHFFLVGILAVLINYALGLYRSVWSFASLDEIVRGVIAAMADSAVLFLVDRVLYHNILHSDGYLPFYAYILAFVLTVLTIIAPRVSIRFFKSYFKPFINKSAKNERVMIVGAGFMGNFVIDALAVDGYAGGQPVIAVDDNPSKMHKKINGIKVVGKCSDIPYLANKYSIDQIIICIPSASKVRQKEIIDLAMQTNAKVKISPSTEEMFESKGKMKVRKVEISDLLSRPEVKLDRKTCRYLIGKTVLVTGGGGSIGSELCMQVARYNPKTIVIFDIYENCAFELANEMNERFDGEMDVHIRIGSVRDKGRLYEVFEEFKPDVVFHAAAHKHVPLMEDSPCEAVKNNVFGTYNVALTADEFSVEKMVIISTDKAVNPTNVMGCTKRITEIIARHMNAVSKNTRYAAVRFGNVLGSHGSVIPIFEKQIAAGGPVCVTHPDITRYFMTIPEAAQLVCQAGGLSNGGEVFVLDMGEPVKIMDLAKNMIRLSGYTEKEIPIKIVGLRPGEKLYEELALESEMNAREKTANEKIYVTPMEDIGDERFNKIINTLNDINDDNVREKLVSIIPNYHPSKDND